MAKDEKQNVTYDEITAHQGRDYGSLMTRLRLIPRSSYMPDAMFIVNKILNGKFPDEE